MKSKFSVIHAWLINLFSGFLLMKFLLKSTTAFKVNTTKLTVWTEVSVFPEMTVFSPTCNNNRIRVMGNVHLSNMSSPMHGTIVSFYEACVSRRSTTKYNTSLGDFRSWTGPQMSALNCRLTNWTRRTRSCRNSNRDLNCSWVLVDDNELNVTKCDSDVTSLLPRDDLQVQLKNK